MNRRTQLLIAAALALVLVVVVAVTQLGGDEPVDEVLAQTFGEEKSIKSGRLELSVRVGENVVPSLQGPVVLRLSGPFSSTEPEQLPRFDFELGLDASGQRLTAGAVSTGDKGFLRFQGQAYAVGEELFEQFRKGYAEQAKCNEGKEEGVSFSTIGVDPRDWLRDPKREGTEEVGGTTAIHITAGVDTARFVEDLNRILGRTDIQEDPCAEDDAKNQPKPSSRQLTDEQRKQIVEAVKDARVDIWTGEDDKTLRRINVDLRLDRPAGEGATATGEGRVQFDLLLGALNEDQDITAPEESRPLDELVAGLQGQQVPGLGGQQQQPEGGGAETAPPPSAGGQSSEYLECAAQAGEDVEKLQECADLVGE